jgi:transcriptional regulator with XRE-family HTH domain
MSQATDLKELRRRLKLTQQEMAVRAGLSVRAVAGYEIGDRQPEPASLAIFADIAARAGHADLCARFARSFLESLKLQRLTHGFAYSDRPAKGQPPEGFVLLTHNDAESARVSLAFALSYFDLRSSDPSRRDRAKKALRPLLAEYGE